MVTFDKSTYGKYYGEDETPSNVAVTGGEFNLKGSGAFLGGSALNSDNGKVAVKGGTFDNKNKIPAGYGYKEVNGKYQIVPVAQIGGNKYYTLAEAFEAANKISEPTVKLLADVNLDTAIEINKTTGIYLHFNFDGHTINSGAENTFIVKKDRFWIQNTNATAGGITQTASGAVIKVVSDGTNEASFKMRESTGSYTIANTADDNTDYVIDISGGSKASASIEGGTISSTYGGLKVSGGATATVTGNSTSITTKGSGNTVGVFVDESSTVTFGKTDKSDIPTITATSTGTDTKSVGILSNGTLTVNSGTITGGSAAVEDNASTTDVDESVALKAGTGVEVHAGKFNFNGGTITGYGSEFKDTDLTNVTDDTTITYPLTSGAGIAISQLDASKSLTFNAAKDTNASGFVALAVTNPKGLTETTTIPSIMVSGGTFTSTGTEGTTATWNDSTKTFSGGKYAFLNKDTRVTVNLAGSIVTGKDESDNDTTINRDSDVFPAPGTDSSGWSSYPENKAFTVPTIKYTQDGKDVYSDETLAQAVEKADADTTIYVLSNQSGNGFTISKNLTIDFGGYTYTITAPTGANAEAVSHIIVGTNAEVTIQNGTIDAESGSTLSTLIESKKTLRRCIHRRLSKVWI